MTDDLIKGLKRRTRAWGDEIKKLANQNLGKFRSLISVTFRTVEKDGRVGLDITATATDPKKPVVRAYEYGSGIHSRVKRRSPHQLPDGRILIRPKTSGKLLAFHWEIANANPELFAFDKKGRVLLPEVRHPGVKAANNGKGYLSPAIAKVRRKMRKEILLEVRESVMGQFKKKFK